MDNVAETTGRHSVFWWLRPLLIAMPLALAACSGSDGAPGPEGPQGPEGPPGPGGGEGPPGSVITGDLSQGVKVEIVTAAVTSSGNPGVAPVVTFKFSFVSDGSPYITFGEDLDAGKIGNGAAFTFAKLAPRSRDDSGQDWVNYVLRSRAARDDAQGTKDLADFLGFTGAIQAGQTHKVNTAGLEHLGDGVYRYTFVDFDLNNVSLSREGISEQIECLDALCWWPDGTALNEGVRIEDDTFYVDYDPSLTHRIGIMLANELMDVGNEASYLNANDAYDFVPNGDPVTVTRDVVAMNSCNSCHENLAFHTGSGNKRTDTRLCVSCHSSGVLDSNSGRSIDFKQLVHKIHYGNRLPSVGKAVPYFVRKSETGDWSAVRYPQLVSEAEGRASGFGIDNCVKCHMGEQTRDALVELAAGDESIVDGLQLATVTVDGDLWRQPSAEACSSCHDDRFWWTGGAAESLPGRLADFYGANGGEDWRTAHSGGTSNSGKVPCTVCHGQASDPVTGLEVGDGAKDGFSALVHRGHLRLTRSVIRSELLSTEIDSVALGDPDADVAGKSPLTVRLRVWDQAQGKALIHGTDATFALGLTVGWRNAGFADYTQSADAVWPGYVEGPRMIAFSCTAGKGANVEHNWDDCLTGGDTIIDIAGPDAGGYYTLTVQLTTDKLPAAGTGTVATHAGVQLIGETWGGHSEVLGGLPPVGAQHVTRDFSIGGSDIVPRREVVNADTCRSCHLRFNKHARTGAGGAYFNPNRNDPQACVICHNPNSTDISRDTAGGTRLGRDGTEGHFDGQREQAIDFKRMVHAIHGKAYLWDGGKRTVRERPMQLRAVLFGGVVAGIGLEPGVGYLGSGIDTVSGMSFGNHRSVYPGRLSNCASCHAGDSYKLPIGGGASVIGTTIDSSRNHPPMDVVGGTGGAAFRADDMPDVEGHRKYSPVMAACSSCHDEPAAAAHMVQAGGSDDITLDLGDPASTGGMNESCAICHGPGRSSDADVKHNDR